MLNNNVEKYRLTKTEVFKVLYRLSEDEIKELADIIINKYELIIIKKPNTSLAMIKMREPVKESLFYIGETIVSNAVVSINDYKGMAVTMGMNLNKALYMAIIDASMNACLEEFTIIEDKLIEHLKIQTEKIEKENGMFLKSTVNFHSMDEAD